MDMSHSKGWWTEGVASGNVRSSVRVIGEERTSITAAQIGTLCRQSEGRKLRVSDTVTRGGLSSSLGCIKGDNVFYSFNSQAPPLCAWTRIAQFTLTCASLNNIFSVGLLLTCRTDLSYPPPHSLSVSSTFFHYYDVSRHSVAYRRYCFNCLHAWFRNIKMCSEYQLTGVQCSLCLTGLTLVYTKHCRSYCMSYKCHSLLHITVKMKLSIMPIWI